MPPWSLLRGKNRSWSNEAGRQPLVLWQACHPVENPALLWFGFEARSKSSRWHDTQSLGVPEKVPPRWQEPQSTRAWAPFYGNPDSAWSKVAGSQHRSLWHAWHSWEKPPARWSG